MEAFSELSKAFLSASYYLPCCSGRLRVKFLEVERLEVSMLSKATKKQCDLIMSANFMSSFLGMEVQCNNMFKLKRDKSVFSRRRHTHHLHSVSSRAAT